MICTYVRMKRFRPQVQVQLYLNIHVFPCSDGVSSYEASYRWYICDMRRFRPSFHPLLPVHLFSPHSAPMLLRLDISPIVGGNPQKALRGLSQGTLLGFGDVLGAILWAFISKS